MEMFLRGAIDVASAMLYNEYHLALNAGIDEQDLTVISFDKDDLDFPEDGLYCTESTLKQKPDICRNFVKASLEGWEYTFSHMDEALALVMKIVTDLHVRTNRAHQRWMLTHICNLIRAPGETDPLGILYADDYENVTTELKNAGLIKTVPRMSDFYAPDFVNH
jgi:NitT/TauT family transport system substrate-binding protein